LCIFKFEKLTPIKVKVPIKKEKFEEKVELTPKGIWEWGESKSVLHEENGKEKSV
jgi:hypothetical protein